ncbi:MAG: shikimate kinase [Archaeoglobaceae archaeon]
MTGKAYAAGTVLNALATGIGCAFGIDLMIKVKFKPDSENILIVNGEERDANIVEKILSNFEKKGCVIIKSEIPERSGLGSSSAFINALLSEILEEEERRWAHKRLRLNAELSLKAGISYTGAFDDASASLLGGFVVSDNYRMALYDWFIERMYAAILIPEFKRGLVDWERIKKEGKKLEKILAKLKEHKFCEVMKENTKFYCEMIGYPLEIAERVWKEEICCGLSGNGPAFVALGSKSDAATAKAMWEDYGKVKIQRIPQKPAESVSITPELFIPNFQIR